MPTFDDDELNDIVPSKAQASKPQQAPATEPPAGKPTEAAKAPAPAPVQQAQAPKPAASEVADLDDAPPPKAPKTEAKQGGSQPSSMAIDWDDEEVTKFTGGIERLRPERGSDKMIRIAFLPYFRPIAHRTHFVATAQGQKFRHLCLSQKGEPAYCCEKLGEEGDMRILALALQYTNVDSKGKYPKGQAITIEYKVGYVDMSRSNFKAIQELPPEGSSIHDIDIAMGRNGNRFQFVMRSAAKWKMNPQLVAEVEEKAKALVSDGGKRLERRLGKKTTLLEWKALLAGATTEAESANLNDMDDLD